MKITKISYYKNLELYSIIIIIYVYQLGTGGHTQEAEPVLGVYP